MQIVEKREATAWVPNGSEILDPGNLMAKMSAAVHLYPSSRPYLHSRPGYLHAGMPSKLFLSLEEADTGLAIELVGF